MKQGERHARETARNTTVANELHARGQELTQVRSSRTFRLLRSVDRLRGRPRA